MIARSVGRTDRTRAAHRAAPVVFGAVLLALGVPGVAGAGQGETAAPSRITALAVSPADGTLWIGTRRGLLRSADEGRTLSTVALPAKGSPAEVTAVAVDARASRTVYVGTAGERIFKSEDGGKNWAAASSGLGGLDVRDVAVSPTDGRLHAQVRGKGLFRSLDGARTWERVDDGPKGTMYTLASVNISTGMGGIFLYAATDQGLVRGPD